MCLLVTPDRRSKAPYLGMGHFFCYTSHIMKREKRDYQYILARDILDMMLDYGDDADALEYLDSIAFSIAMILEDDSVVDWYEISSMCDCAWYSMKQGGSSEIVREPVERMSDKYQREIDKFSEDK